MQRLAWFAFLAGGLLGCQQAYEHNSFGNLGDRADASRIGVLSPAPREGRIPPPGMSAGQGAATRPNTAIEAPVSAMGKVARVSSNTLTLDLQAQGQVEFRIAPDTEVRIDGKPAPASELRPGDRAIASFFSGRAFPVAQRIDAWTSKLSPH